MRSQLISKINRNVIAFFYSLSFLPRWMYTCLCVSQSHFTLFICAIIISCTIQNRNLSTLHLGINFYFISHPITSHFPAANFWSFATHISHSSLAHIGSSHVTHLLSPLVFHHLTNAIKISGIQCPLICNMKSSPIESHREFRGNLTFSHHRRRPEQICEREVMLNTHTSRATI